MFLHCAKRRLSGLFSSLYSCCMTLITCMLTKILLCLMIFLFAWLIKDGIYLVGEIRSTGQPMVTTVVRNKALIEMLDHEKEQAQKRLSNMDAVLAQNSDPLPNRLTNQTADEMCKETKKCAPKFLHLETRVRTAPNHKMVTCVVQKSMSTVMTAVMCYLYNELEFLKTGRNFMQEWSRFRLCKDKNEYNSISVVKEKLGIKNAKDWSYSMVTRDPVERFISGFVDRCIRKPLGSKPCNGCKYNMTCFVETEYERMMGQVRAGHLKRSFEDVHLFPQNWRCELQKEYKNFEFIRYSTSDPKLFLNDLLKIAEKQNVTKVSRDFMKAQISESKTVHVTAHSPARKYLEDRLRKSPYLMEYVVKMFYHDFRLFRYKFPKGF